MRDAELHYQVRCASNCSLFNCGPIHAISFCSFYEPALQKKYYRDASGTQHLPPRKVLCRRVPQALAFLCFGGLP